MKSGFLVFVFCTLSVGSRAQNGVRNISATELQKIKGGEIGQAVKARETYKVPLNEAYVRQMGQVGKDCQKQSDQGQQTYNLCMGRAGAEADKDFALFYNNLQMLCHDQAQLATLQTSEVAWLAYEQSSMKATHASWPDGTGAPGFAGQVYLSLVRDRMRELDEIYGLNIAQ